MGVTLERVQFRFASIIGELCNEPQVLSQFAVWLDMRLAEFKLKGSISLDCSGEPAPPGWMDGLEDAIIKRASRRRKSKQGRSGTNDDEGEITIMEDRKSDLATDYIANNNYSSENNRKRTFETWHCEEPESTSPKMLRFSKSGNGESIHNQNLLSVISIEHSSPSEEDKSQIHSDSRADYSSEQIHSGADYSSELIHSRADYSSKQIHSGADYSSELIHSGADYSGDQTHSQIDLSESQDFTSQERDLSRYFSPAQSSSMPEPSSFNRSLPQQSSLLGDSMGITRKRSVWSPDERCLIQKFLLPIVQRTKKPPMKADIQELMQREPLLSHRHWEKIKFQAWSLYQHQMKKLRGRSQETSAKPDEGHDIINL